MLNRYLTKFETSFKLNRFFIKNSNKSQSWILKILAIYKKNVFCNLTLNCFRNWIFFVEFMPKEFRKKARIMGHMCYVKLSLVRFCPVFDIVEPK